jgi:hypothetical protein
MVEAKLLISKNGQMKKSQQIILIGSSALLLGAFLPWISVPNLFGKVGAAYEGIEIGWEGDGIVTGGIGLLLLLGVLMFKGRFGKRFSLAEVILAFLAGTIVFQDFLRIAEIDPATGVIAATDVGLYVTLLGALVALVGGVQEFLQNETNLRGLPVKRK